MNEYEKKHIEMLRDGLSECAVLLKKDGKFPLDGTCDIALYGGGARHTIKGGTGSGEVNSRYSVSVEEGLIDAGFQITTGEWLDAYDRILEKARVDFLKEIKRKARENHISAIIQGMGAVMREPEYDLPLNAGGDACVYVVSRISGEGNDRNTVKGDVLLTDSEVRDIAILSEKFEKFMLVLNVGGPVDLTPVKSVGNILVLSQLGVETGAALADIVLGRTNPSGHLTTTWAALNDYQQIGNFGEYDDTDYKEGIFVGYRYTDVAGKKPLFPFGFGLSYTEFEIYHKDTTLWHDEVTVKVEIKNTGNRAGKEVLQVYVSAPDGKLIKPVKELCGFDKTGLMSPGGCEDLSVRFKLRDFASYDEERSSYILEPGDYLVSIGDSSDKTKVVAVVNIPSEIITCKAKNLLGDPG
nr:glycoside hydrolase family 3 C-terminal domain-containing protein [Lachnospiraceae bacterium]